MQQDDHLTWSLQKRLTRRELLKGAALAGVGVAGTALVGCAGAAVTPTPVPTAIPTKPGRRTAKWPIQAVATNLEGTYKWWVDEERNNAGSLEDLTLTAEEEAKVKAMGLIMGCDYGGEDLTKAIESRCQQLGIEPFIIKTGSSMDARKHTAKMYVSEGVDAVFSSSPGTDFTFTEVVKTYYEAGIPTFASSRPLTSYYPTTCTMTDNPYKVGAESARILAQKMAAAGYKEAQVAQISVPLGMHMY